MSKKYQQIHGKNRGCSKGGGLAEDKNTWIYSNTQENARKFKGRYYLLEVDSGHCNTFPSSEIVH